MTLISIRFKLLLKLIMGSLVWFDRFAAISSANESVFLLFDERSVGCFSSDEASVA